MIVFCVFLLYCICFCIWHFTPPDTIKWKGAIADPQNYRYVEERACVSSSRVGVVLTVEVVFRRDVNLACITVQYLALKITRLSPCRKRKQYKKKKDQLLIVCFAGNVRYEYVSSIAACVARHAMLLWKPFIYEYIPAIAVFLFFGSMNNALASARKPQTDTRAISYIISYHVILYRVWCRTGKMPPRNQQKKKCYNIAQEQKKRIASTVKYNSPGIATSKCQKQEEKKVQEQKCAGLLISSWWY